jgi:undecaprenyl-diphosphatase
MRPDHDNSPAVRLTVASAGAVVLLVPFALLAALIVGNSSRLHGLDQRITDALHGFALRHDWWVLLMEVWSWVFDPNVWRVAALGLVIWLVRRGAKPLAWWVAITMVTGGVLNAVLKLLIGRDRPELLEPVSHAVGYAFPSGHALNNALGAAVFLLVLLPVVRARKTLWAAAVLIPLVTAVSRVALGVHWASDVVAGLLLGVAVAAITSTAFLARRRQRNPEVLTEGLEPEIAEHR